MNLKLSFSWVGLVVFALPMLINIAYAVFPPVGKAEQGAVVPHWIEIVEQISRIAYLAAITLLVSREPIPKCLALACCLVPHIVLCRMDPIFCRRAGDRLVESRVSLCPDAACGISRALFLVCCRLAA